MPSPTRCLTAGDAVTLVRDLAIHPSTGSPRVGLELEWLTYLTADRCRRVDVDALAPVLARADGALPCGGRLTVEPGGQLELSTRPLLSVADAIDAARTDLTVVRAACADAGIELVAAGLDRERVPQRVVDAPRYRAMQAYFDADGWHGRTMMCNTASLQINVDVDGDVRDAWRAAHLVAARASSTYNQSRPNRDDIWGAIDCTRTAAVGGTDPRDAWARYALAARVMFVRVAPDECTPVHDGITFRDWIERGHPLGWPTEADLCEHLTTLFPPVRPRGWLELRTLDALDDDRWPAAVTDIVEHVLDGPARRALLEPAWH